MENLYKFYVDIEVYNLKKDSWEQAKYLAHGYNDVLWTNCLDEALKFLKQQIIENSSD